MAARDRLTELDALRGLAALLVLAHHAFQILPHEPPTERLGVAYHILMHLSPLRVIEYGRAAVLFFFVLSGFVLTRALLRNGSPGLVAYAAQRSIRLGLPVVASVLLSALLGLWLAPLAPPEEWLPFSLFVWPAPLTPALLATQALLLPLEGRMPLNVALWSLVHEWRLTLLLPLVLAFRGRLALLAALTGLAMWAGIALGAPENRALLGHSLAGSVVATFYFAGAIGSGVLLAMACAPRIPEIPARARLPLGLLALALFAMASDLAAYAGSALLILLACQQGRFATALRVPPGTWLGRHSFSLYLVHMPVMTACIHLGWRWLSKPALVLIGVAAALLASAAFHRLVEEPARLLARRAQRWLQQPPGSGASSSMRPSTENSPKSITNSSATPFSK